MLGVKHSQQFTLEEAGKFPERSLIRVDESLMTAMLRGVAEHLQTFAGQRRLGESSGGERQ